MKEFKESKEIKDINLSSCIDYCNIKCPVWVSTVVNSKFPKRIDIFLKSPRGAKGEKLGKELFIKRVYVTNVGVGDFIGFDDSWNRLLRHSAEYTPVNNQVVIDELCREKNKKSRDIIRFRVNFELDPAAESQHFSMFPDLDEIERGDQYVINFPDVDGKMYLVPNKV